MSVNTGSQIEPLEFWAWVQNHQMELARSQQGSNSKAVDDAAAILHRYDPSLGFEVSTSNGCLEVTVTAFGQTESFGAVKTLVEACPTATGLKAIAFRQPEGPDFELEADGRTFSPQKTYFEPMKGRLDPRTVGLMIFFTDADDVSDAARLRTARIMLQAILGEYEAALRIDHVEVADTSGVELSKYIQLSKVGDYLSWVEKRNVRALQ